MHPEVIGFERSGFLTNDLVSQFIADTFRESILIRIGSVRYIDTYKSTLNEQDDFDSIFRRGLYIASAHFTDESSDIDMIDVYRQDLGIANDKEFMLHCIAHEIGHSVYDHMPEDMKLEWRRASESSPACEFVTQRAYADEIEDFCETFAVYHLNPEKLARLSPRKSDVLGSILPLYERTS